MGPPGEAFHAHFDAPPFDPNLIQHSMGSTLSSIRLRSGPQSNIEAILNKRPDTNNWRQVRRLDHAANAVGGSPSRSF
jgi:hypothetical protein